MRVPERAVVTCFDVDHQGGDARYTVAKGDDLAAFPPKVAGGRMMS
jgi:hypothetical protein